jgi:MarR family transcriptional regulator, organic hydroperoxide resistance regulator
MTKAKSNVRRDRIARSQSPQKSAASTEEPFPPLSTSLESFVKDGSDRAFRRLIYDLISFSNQMALNRKHFAAYIGVTEAQVLMMMIIAETQDATVGHLAQQLNVSSQFVTIEIGDLVKKNIIEKRPNEADRRSMFLSLTHKGRSLFREMAPLRRTASDLMFRSLTEDRARVLQEIISALLADSRIALHELEGLRLHGEKAPSA